MSRNRSGTRYRRDSSPAHSSPNSRVQNGIRPRFEELGVNYGFARADPGKNVGYCFVYRTLMNKLEQMGVACRIRADDNEIRISELEGPLQQRDRFRIFTHDIISYYKFNHRTKFAAICIDAYHRRKTGYWFLYFEREGQLSAFCEYLNWLFGLDVSNAYDGEEEDRVSYVDRRSRSVHSFLLDPRSKRYDSDRYEPYSYDSGYTDSASEVRDSSLFPPHPPKVAHPKYSSQTFSGKRNFRRW